MPVAKQLFRIGNTFTEYWIILKKIYDNRNKKKPPGTLRRLEAHGID